MTLPDDRKYSPEHEWVKADGDLYLVGITDNAQEQLGDLVFVGDVKVGQTLAAGDTAGVVESVKAASDLIAPVNCKVVAFNQVLDDQPELLNEAPMETWIYKIQVDDPSE